MRSTIMFPFRCLFFAVTICLRIIGFLLSFSFRALRFMAGSFFAVLFAAIIGLFVGRKLFSGKKS